ncbi:MAG: ferredoxin reductase [Acidimicrobiia bacterium]|nr:ferredoxin reductase [Acidimicrobiia bacterium]
MRWLVAKVTETIPETASAVTIRLDVPDWPGHRAGQHVDVRLTAEDGYQAQRSYSIASAPGADLLELTVVRIDDGEVSPYLTTDLDVGDQIELRGPVGGYFVWDGAGSGTQPVLLAGGGSGVVPLMSMLRHHETVGSEVAMHLVYSARTAGDLLYRDELAKLGGVTITLTREPSSEWPGRRGRVDSPLLAEAGWLPSEQPQCFVCGPDSFVEAVANTLVEMGHDPQNVRTERFGPTGG